MIKLNKFKTGISRRNRIPVYLGLSYVHNLDSPNVLLRGTVRSPLFIWADPPVLITREVIQIAPMPEPMSMIFYVDYINLLKTTNSSIGCVKIPDA